jgi:hypothetical protein
MGERKALAVCYAYAIRKTFGENMKITLIYWKCFILLLSWALLGCGLMLINHVSARVTPVEFGAVLIASAAYLIGTTSLLKPITKNTK